MKNPTPEKWTMRDAGTGLLLATAGALILTVTALATKNGWGILFGAGWLLGPTLIVIGLHAVGRAALSGLSSDDRQENRPRG